MAASQWEGDPGRHRSEGGGDRPWLLGRSWAEGAPLLGSQNPAHSSSPGGPFKQASSQRQSRDPSTKPPRLLLIL